MPCGGWKTSAATIYSRLVEGRFPRYQDVIPAQSQIRIDLATGRPVREYPETRFNPGRSGWDVAFAPDGRTLVTHVESAVQACDVATGEVLAHLDFGESIQTMAVSPTGRHLAVGHHGGTLRLLPLEVLRAD